MQDRDWNTAESQNDTAQAVLDAPRDLAGGLLGITAWTAPTAKFEDDLDDLDGDDPFADDEEDDDLDLDDEEDDDDDLDDDFDDDDLDDGFDDEEDEDI